MNDIQSAKYLADEDTNLNRAVHLFLLGDKQMTVPLDPSNRHYAEIMRQVDAGTLVIAEAE